jgi:cysteinyl-tRNA synthetase
MKNIYDHIHLKIYNTETRQKEIVFPIDGKQIRMYVCGPTVYNFAHIGNFRTYVFEDLLRRTLEFFGFDVKMVMNITDVDDKTIKGAIEKNTTLDVFIKPYLDAFYHDLKVLKIKPADIYPKATDFIEQMIEMISNLVEKGYAYQGADNSIYFSVQKFKQYGRLSHLKLNELKVGGSKRINSDEYDKDVAADFVLWKAYDKKRDGEIYWDSLFGKGRPGWHLECSTMAMNILGESIDLHCGGVDNIFPHHENEIAQSECYSGRKFAKIWAHSEHLLVDGKKMSKSLGNFYTLEDLLKKGYSGEIIRYMLLQAHYRTQLNFTLKGLDASIAAIQRIRDFIDRLGDLVEDKMLNNLDEIINNAKLKFAEALADDLNISLAMSSLFDFIRGVNQLIDDSRLGKSDAEKIFKFLELLNQVLAFLPLQQTTLEIPADIQDAFQKREKARREKNWALSDELRDFITDKGYKVEDNPKGSSLKKL